MGVPSTRKGLDQHVYGPDTARSERRTAADIGRLWLRSIEPKDLAPLEDLVGGPPKRNGDALVSGKQDHLMTVAAKFCQGSYVSSTFRYEEDD